MRSSLSRLALTAVLFAPAAAIAAPNAVEFQLQAAPLLDLVQRKALAMPPSCPEPFGSPAFVLDHLTWGAPVLKQAASTGPVSFTQGTVQAKAPQIGVPVVASIKSVSCVGDPSCSSTIDVPVTIDFELTASSTQICADFAGTEGPIPPDAQGQVDDLIKAVGPMCTDLSLSSVTGLLGDGVTVKNVGIQANAAKNRIGVRIELDPKDGSAGSTLSDWQSFENGTLAQSSGSGFSLAVDQQMLRNVFGKRLHDGIANSGDLTPTSSVSSLWMPVPVPDLSLAMDADLDTDFCFNDIGIEPISMNLPFALTSDHAGIEVDATIDWDLDDGDVFLCGFLNPLGWLTGGLPLETFGILEAVADGYSAQSQLDGALPAECTTIDDNHVDCAFPFALPSLDLGGGSSITLAATQLTGTSEGLSLEGTATVGGFHPMQPQPITLDTSDVTYGVQGDCSSLHLGYSGAIYVGGGPGEYCPDPYSQEMSPLLTNDKYDLFALDDVDGGPPDDIEIEFPWNDPTPYFQNPYPIQVTVWSTVGSASATFLADEKSDNPWIYIGELAKAIGSCYAIPVHPVTPWVEAHWLVDPPPYELVTAGDDLWTKYGSKVWLKDAELEQVGEVQLDEKTGFVTMPARSGVIHATFAVESEAGSFAFETQFALPGDLLGAAVEGGNVFTPEYAADFKVEVPSEALPKGLRSATVVGSLHAGDLAWEVPTATAKR